MTIVRADHRGSAKSQPPLNADPCTTATRVAPSSGVPRAMLVAFPRAKFWPRSPSAWSSLHGKGPTKARTYAVGDLVVCVLQGGLTTGDRILLDHGRVDAVVASREDLARYAARPRRGHDLCDRSYAAGGRFAVRHGGGQASPAPSRRGMPAAPARSPSPPACVVPAPEHVNRARRIWLRFRRVFPTSLWA